jgi:hypothetical protein
VGPFGTGQVNEYSGPYLFGTAQFGSDPHAALNVAYYFHNAAYRPFVVGGLGAEFGGDTQLIGVRFGGGIDWWLRERQGLRVEIYDQLSVEFGTTHLIVVRVGVVFR